MIPKGRKPKERIPVIMLVLSPEGQANQSTAGSLSRRDRHQRSGNQKARICWAQSRWEGDI